MYLSFSTAKFLNRFQDVGLVLRNVKLIYRLGNLEGDTAFTNRLMAIIDVFRPPKEQKLSKFTLLVASRRAVIVDNAIVNILTFIMLIFTFT